VKLLARCSALTLALFLSTAAFAQTPLPPNYQTILDNHDLLVMRVHYGPHEFVPLHDHSAYPTVFVYLNDSGVLRIDHAPPSSFSVQRPPTQTGAFRIAPGMIERHSITNLSELPSDFLRVELKTIPPTAIKDVFRGPAPNPPTSGTHTDYQSPTLRIDRIVCPPTTPCDASPSAARSLLVAITPFDLQTLQILLTPTGKQHLSVGDVTWLPTTQPLQLTPGAQALRITLLYPD
jgi:hypothetical protein